MMRASNNPGEENPDGPLDMPAGMPVKAGVVIEAGSVLCGRFLGAGVQWDPPDSGIPDFTEQQWERICRRIDFMRAGFARVMLAAEYYVSGFDGRNRPRYDWNSAQMQRLYRILDYCQSRGVTVMIGEWNKPFWARTYEDARWMEAIVEFLDHMRNSKGYTCIAYYNFVNEPNGDWMMPDTTPEQRWLRWESGVRALHGALDRCGFLDWISICGPDSAYDDEWVDRCADTMPEVMGQYEFHIYKDYDREVLDGSIEKLVAQKRKYITEHDPQGAAKHLWLGELGMKERCNFDLDCQDRVYDFDYGVLILDASIQAIRGGAAGIIPWDLDDAMHFGSKDSASKGQLKRWGMWNSLGGLKLGEIDYPPGDTELRPWYYTMSLCTRLFPAGCKTVYASEPGTDHIRVAAARIEKGARRDLSVMLVNESDAAQTVRLTVPEARGNISLNKYHYFKGDRPVDCNGFPAIKEVLAEVDLAKGMEVVLPSRGAVLLTSLETGPAIQFGQL
jgi:hypothetical protein